MNSSIEKRKYFSYAILNAVTFGIYGIIVRSKIAADIDAICASDGQQHKHTFGQAWIFSKLYNLMIAALIGLPLSIAGAVSCSFIGFFSPFLVFLAGIAATVFVAFTLEGLYLPSWWYSQHNRLVLNAHRYKMILNDNAFDTAVWKALVYIPMNVLSVLGYMLVLGGIGCFIAFVRESALAALLSLFGGLFLSMVVLFLKNIINLPFYYTLRSVNRFADNMSVSYVGPYEPMGLIDEDNSQNIFSRTIHVLDTFGSDKAAKKDEPKTILGEDKAPVRGGGVFAGPEKKNPIAPQLVDAKIECIAGNNNGYVYNLSAGEELIIGKDPKIANIVISPEYKDVSRRHCGIKYDKARDQYVVTDYSSNGTKVNGSRIEAGRPILVARNSKLALGKGDNAFIVK